MGLHNLKLRLLVVMWLSGAGVAVSGQPRATKPKWYQGRCYI